jgi:hypothetical protein
LDWTRRNFGARFSGLTGLATSVGLTCLAPLKIS